MKRKYVIKFNVEFEYQNIAGESKDDVLNKIKKFMGGSHQIDISKEWKWNSCLGNCSDPGRERITPSEISIEEMF